MKAPHALILCACALCTFSVAGCSRTQSSSPPRAQAHTASRSARHATSIKAQRLKALAGLKAAGRIKYTIPNPMDFTPDAKRPITGSKVPNSAKEKSHAGSH